MTMTPPTPQHPRGTAPLVDIAFVARPLYRLQRAAADAEHWFVVVADRNGDAGDPQIGGW